MMGAVPSRFSMTSQRSGTRACARLIASISSPRLCRMSWMMASWPACSTKPVLPESSARTPFVISSFVGPKPPVVMTISLCVSSLRRLFRISSRSSPIESMRVTRMPASSRAAASREELVSTIWPMRISLPIVQMDAWIIGIGKDCRSPPGGVLRWSKCSFRGPGPLPPGKPRTAKGRRPPQES